MNARVQCPVCHYDHISEDRGSCPQCNADLECFRLLEKLGDSQEKKQPSYHEKKTGVLKSLVLILGITVILLFIYIAYRFSIMGDLMQQQKEGLVRVIASLDNYSQKEVQLLETPKAQDTVLKHDIETLMDIIETNADRLNRIEAQISDIKSPQNILSWNILNRNILNQNILKMINRIEQEPCFKTYRIKNRDTLWSIARDLYGSGFLYPVLLVHNPDIHIYNIRPNDQLRYLCDPSQARTIYKDAIGKKQNSLYLKYMVRPGDTRSEIAKRYCPNNRSDNKSGKKKCFIDDTLLEPVEPGKIIGIYLE